MLAKKLKCIFNRFGNLFLASSNIAANKILIIEI